MSVPSRWDLPPEEWGGLPGRYDQLPIRNPPEPAPPQPQPKPRAYIEVQPGSRLEQLRIHRQMLTAQFADTKARLDAVKTAIRNEMINAAPPGTEIIELPASPDGPGLTVVWSRHHRFDTRQFKVDFPEVYEEYRVNEPRWELRETRPGD